MFSLDAACQYYNSDFTTFSQEYKDFLKKFFLAQIDSYEYGNTGMDGMYIYLELLGISKKIFWI